MVTAGQLLCYGLECEQTKCNMKYNVLNKLAAKHTALSPATCEWKKGGENYF